MIKRLPRKERHLKKNPNGMHLLALEEQLLKNRIKLVNLLKNNPEILNEYLQKEVGLDVKNFKTPPRFEASKTSPGIIIFVETVHPFDSSIKARSTITNFFDVGSIAVSLIKTSVSAKHSKEILAHEESHFKGLLRVEGTTKANYTIIEFIEEELFDELISEVAAGQEKKLVHLTEKQILWFIDTYGMEYIYERFGGNIEKMSSALQELDNAKNNFIQTCKTKEAIINGALKILPKGEVIMVLRKSGWHDIEKDLAKRIEARKKYKK